MKEENNIELNFSDHTILESEGNFDKTNKIMEEDMWKNHKWMIESGLTVKSENGIWNKFKFIDCLYII